MTDPFDGLLMTNELLAPTPEFATELRVRIEGALGFIPNVPPISLHPKGRPSMTRTLPGQHVVTAYICCSGAADALDFYSSVFGAVEVGQRYVDQTDGRIGHAEFVIGDTRLMISDEYPEVGAVSPETLGGSSTMFSLYVDDVDAVFSQAVSSGARGLRVPEDQPYGTRMGSILDPWGHRWSIQTVTDGVERGFDGFDLVSAPTEPVSAPTELTP
jgi:PhnB protein